MELKKYKVEICEWFDMTDQDTEQFDMLDRCGLFAILRSVHVSNKALEMTKTADEVELTTTPGLGGVNDHDVIISFFKDGHDTQHLYFFAEEVKEEE